MACSACLKARRQMLAALRTGNGPGVVQAVRFAGAINRDKLREKFQQHAQLKREAKKPR